MKLSIYTFVKDGLYYDYHLVAMLRHHLPLADEIVVNEGYSTDGTYEAIKDLDPKIRVSRNRLDTSEPKAWHRRAKDQARRLCTGDWCILLDCDEFIPEWEFDRLRTHLDRVEKDILTIDYLHFYGNYKVLYDNVDRAYPPRQNRRIHRNRPDVEVVGDGSDVKLPEQGSAAEDASTSFAVHHFGEVRQPSRLRHKWHIQTKVNVQNRWHWVPGMAFDLKPHNWFDQDFLKYLKPYEGPYIEAVRADPAEFIRDDFALYRYLTSRDAPGSSPGTSGRT